MIGVVTLDDTTLLPLLERAVERLRPLHDRPPPVRPGDWLDVHEEQHQSLDDYIASRPARVERSRRRLEVVPIGELPPAHEGIVHATTDYMAAFFGLPVTRAPFVPTVTIPVRARRRAPGDGQEQLLTSWLREHVLLPRVNEGTALVLGLTAVDLWPGRGWNFVFGEASLRERVGVWSLARLGDPVVDREACLMRTLKTAAHEAAHMLSIPHCTAYACLMAGSNSIEESDERPLWLCPECLAKVCWAMRLEPELHLQAVSDVLNELGLDFDARHHARDLAELGRAEPAPGP